MLLSSSSELEAWVVFRTSGFTLFKSVSLPIKELSTLTNYLKYFNLFLRDSK